MFFAPLTACKLHLCMVHGKEGRQIFNVFHHRLHFKRLLSQTTILYIEMRLWGETGTCAYLVSNSFRILRRYSFSDKKTPGPVCIAATRSVSSRTRPLQKCFTAVHFYSSLSPCLSNSAPFTLHSFHHQLSRQSILSFSNVFLFSVFPLDPRDSPASSPVSQRLGLFSLQLFPFLQCRKNKPQNLSRRLLRRSTTVVQRPRSSTLSFSERSKLCHSGKPPADRFFYSPRGQRRTYPLLVY